MSIGENACDRIFKKYNIKQNNNFKTKIMAFFFFI